MIGYTLMVEVIWKTAANPGETFTQFCAEKYKGFESYERFSLPVMSDDWFVKSVNLIRQTM